MKIKVVLQPDPEGGYTALVPSLPGCISEGESEQEALANIKEAIEGCLEAEVEEITITTCDLVREIEI